MNTFRLYLRFINIQVRSQLQYRVPFWFDIMAAGVSLSLYFLATALIFQRFDHIGGWRLGEVAFLWGLVELSFGIMDMVFSGFDPINFSELVRRGGFDQLLLRPVGITLQILGSRFITRRIGRVLEGLVIFALALSLTRIEWTVAKILYLPVVVISLVIFFGALFIAGSTITFWTIQPVEAVNIFTYGGAELLSYPAHIYPDWLVRFFMYIVPGILVNYYPALYFLDKPDPFGLPAWLSFAAPLVSSLVFLLALAFWKFGIRHYQGTGT
jgi:ABC-2 type transport system permease protein